MTQATVVSSVSPEKVLRINLFAKAVKLGEECEIVWDDVIALWSDRTAKTVDTEKKAIDAAIWREWRVSIKAPGAVVGSDAYKGAAKNANAHWSKCTKAALVRAGIVKLPDRTDSTVPKVPTTTATPATGTEKAPEPGSNDVGVSVAAMIAEAASRSVSIESALLAFQSEMKLTKAATDAIGDIAAEFGKLLAIVHAVNIKVNKSN